MNALGTLEREWEPYSPCPCGCGVVSSKLSPKTGHARGCACPSCRGRRNRKAGPDTARKRHRALGGVGRAISDDLAHAYSVDVSVEDKRGLQIPANFRTFTELEWTRHALAQASKKTPIGSDAMPALFLDLGRGGCWLVAQVPTKGLR